MVNVSSSILSYEYIFGSSKMFSACTVLFLLVITPFKTLGKLKTDYPLEDYVQRNGYPVETHETTTEDGYILKLHRIPNGRNGEINGKIVFLLHGVMLSSYSWILSKSENSLAFLLADQGYDVWMGNTRGNVYSRNHTKLKPDEDAIFWNFSFHEMGVYDLSASIDYILKHKRKESLYYIGYSQGCTSMYVLTSLKPEYNNKIKAYVHLAPIGFKDHIKSPVMRIIASFVDALKDVVKFRGGEELLPSNNSLHEKITKMCASRRGTIVCELFISPVVGFSLETDSTLFPELVKHASAGSSTKEFVHQAQQTTTGRFALYDYGPAGNMEKYGDTLPPVYNLKNVVSPGYIFFSVNDYLADYKFDIPKLFNSLGNAREKIQIPSLTFNHLDFIIGVNARKFVYSNVIDILYKN